MGKTSETIKENGGISFNQEKYRTSAEWLNLTCRKMVPAWALAPDYHKVLSKKKNPNNLTTLACQRLQHRLWQETSNCSSMGKVFEQTCICADLRFYAKATAAFWSQDFMAAVTILAGKLRSISPDVPWQTLFPISPRPPSTPAVFYSVCPSPYCCAGPLSITVVFSVEFSLARRLLYKTAAYLTVCPS